MSGIDLAGLEVGHGTWMLAGHREYRLYTGLRPVARGDSEDPRSPRNQAYFHRVNVSGGLGPRKRKRCAGVRASVRWRRREAGPCAPRVPGRSAGPGAIGKKALQAAEDLPPCDAILPGSCRVIDRSVGSLPLRKPRGSPRNFAQRPSAWKQAALVGQTNELYAAHRGVGTPTPSAHLAAGISTPSAHLAAGTSTPSAHLAAGTSMTVAPSGGSKRKVSAGGSVLIFTSAKATRVTFPKRSTTSLARTRPLAGSTSMVRRS